jgi:transposase
MKRKRAKPVYKEYTMGQIMLLPVDLDEIIPANHLVRVISEFVERMDLSCLEAKYKGGGTSSYHPKMMLKVYLYSYTQKIFSSRRIAKGLRESIPFMWLSGNNRPDFRTINYFRGHILKGLIEKIFVELLLLLIEEGYIKLEDYFVDGTKLEANANKYSFVWAKSTAYYEKQLAEKVKGLFEEIERLNTAEDAHYGERDLEEVGEAGAVTAEKMAQRVGELNERLKKEGSETEAEDEHGPHDQQPPKKEEQAEPLSKQIEDKLTQAKQQQEHNPHNQAIAKAAKALEEECLPRAKKYEDQKQKLAGRNSYSKTDVDATFMRMKEDAMKNGQLKAAYNIQIGTENQFVVGFSLHQEAGDTNCLIPHLEKVKGWLEKLPLHVVSDAGYGSEENYAYLDREKVGNYLKYAGFDREQKKRFKPDPFKAENMPYDAEKDEFTCPNQQPVKYVTTRKEKTKNGYWTEQRVYVCSNCQGCALKDTCTKADKRQMRVNFQLWKYRQQARENLLSPEGQRLRSQRGVDVETVFGRLKEDWGFRRFLLRGLKKVTIEWGLICMAHNLAKVWSAHNDLELSVV